MALVLKYATGTQLANAFRARYKNSTGAEAARLAKWLLSRIADGTWTDTQVRNAFNLTVGQYDTMKLRMQTIVTNWDAVVAAQGE